MVNRESYAQHRREPLGTRRGIRQADPQGVLSKCLCNRGAVDVLLIWPDSTCGDEYRNEL